MSRFAFAPGPVELRAESWRSSYLSPQGSKKGMGREGMIREGIDKGWEAKVMVGDVKVRLGKT